MPESVPSSLIIDTFKDIFRPSATAPSARIRSAGSSACRTRTRRRVLAALDKERALRVVTCSTEDEANARGRRPLDRPASRCI